MHFHQCPLRGTLTTVVDVSVVMEPLCLCCYYSSNHILVHRPECYRLFNNISLSNCS